MCIKCSLLSNNRGIDARENIEGINEWPHKWEQDEISYRLENFSQDITNIKHQERAITIALRAWQLRIPLKFKRERNRDTSVDFNISFEDLDHFDGKKGVLAHAYFPQNTKLSGDVHINDEWNWSSTLKFQSLSRPPLVPILIHEFGHSLGLRHDTTTQESIMYPSFDLGKKKYKLHRNDVDRIQSKYGERQLSQRLLDYFALRRLRGYDFR